MVAADDDVFVQNDAAAAFDPKTAAGAGRIAAGDRTGTDHVKLAGHDDDAAFFGFLRQRAVNGAVVQIQRDLRA